MTSTNENNVFQEQDDQQDQDEQEEINVNFQRLIELDELKEEEEKEKEISCCIVCKIHIKKGMNFCNALCENQFNIAYDQYKIKSNNQ
jgi:hypothetical protein